MPGNEVDDAALVSSSSLEPDDEAVDARLDVVLDAGEGVETKLQQPLAISVSDGAGEEKADEALRTTRMRARRANGAEPKESKWSQLCHRDGFCPSSASERGKVPLYTRSQQRRSSRWQAGKTARLGREPVV